MMMTRNATVLPASALLATLAVVVLGSSACDVRCDPALGDDTCPSAAPFCIDEGEGRGRCSATPSADPGAGNEPARDAGRVIDAGPIDAGRSVDAGVNVDAGSSDAGGSDGGSSQDAGPNCQEGAPCQNEGDCVGPCGQEASCFDATCTPAGCTYVVDATRVCIEAGCQAGVLYPETVCGAAGSCNPATTTTCDGYQCAVDGVSCRSSCADGTDCVEGYFCRENDDACLPLLADGENCSAVGDVGCASAHCDGQLCCSGGDCCNTAADCPAAYSREVACDDPTSATNCQGTRIDPTCDENVCGTVVIDDDSACAAAALGCPNNLAPVACTSDGDQAAPVCPTVCGADDCADGFDCVEGDCQPLLGLGNECGGATDPSCSAGLKCESGRCCEESGGTCCDAVTESTACSDGLACDLLSFACATSCVPGTSEGCADDGDYCVDGASCVVKKGLGFGCAGNGECATGNCVDGFCCDGACGGTCQACSSALTGVSDGTCADIVSGTEPGLCDAAGNGCDGTSCVCASGTCAYANGAVCASDDVCGSGNCECADSSCTTKRCNNVACALCKYDSTYADSSCTLNTAGNACSTCSTPGNCVCGSGSCLRGNGAGCTSPGQCATGNCECADSTCSARKCSAVDCPACKYNSSGDTTCEGSIVKGDSGACPSGQVCKTTGGVCASPGSCSCQCAAIGCEFGPATCSAGAPDTCNSGFHPQGNCSVTGCNCTSCSAGGSCTCVVD